MSHSDEIRRRVQAEEIDRDLLQRETPGSKIHLRLIRIVYERKQMLATALFWEGIKEKSRLKVEEGLMLLKEFISYLESHFGEDVSYDYSFALRIARENLSEEEAQLHKESWW